MRNNTACFWKHALLTGFLILNFILQSGEMMECFSQSTFQKAFGSGQGGYNNKWDYATSVKQTADGGFIVTGYSDGTGIGQDDIYLVKFDANGDTAWTRVFGGSNKEYGRCVIQTSDGGYAVCGETQSFGVFKNDVFLLKTDGSGNLSWAKTYGGTDEDFGYSLVQTSDGGFIVAGKTMSFGQGGGYYDVYLVKTDSVGNMNWTRTYGGTSDDIAFSIQPVTGGNYIITGADGSFNYGVLLMKINSSGDTSWVRSIRGGYGGYSGLSVQQAADGGYILTGYTTDAGIGSYDIFLVKTTSAGSVSFTKAFGSSSLDEGRAVRQTFDGGYVLSGYSYAGSTYSQLHTIKTNASGTTQWSKVYRSAYGNEGHDIIQTADTGYAMTGYVYYNFGDTLPLLYQGYDAYLVKTDPNGESPGCVSNASGMMSMALTWTAYNSPMVKSSGGTEMAAAMSSKPSLTNVDDAAVKLNFSVTEITCGSACNGTIAATTCDISGFYCSGAGPFTYIWDNGQTASTATGLCSGAYNVSITDANSCKGIGSAIVSTQAPMQEICLISVDSTSTKNVVVWEKPVTSGIDSFRIYREIGAGNYVHIRSVAYNDLSEFTDATQGINPNITSYKYKISVLDTCGNESALSAYHKTIKLTVNLGTPPEVNLAWEAYVGFTYTLFYVLRDDNGTNNWQVIDSVAATNFLYTNIPPSSSTRYRIEARSPVVCTAQKIKNYNASKSNTASTQIGPGFGELQANRGLRVSVIPNPFNESALFLIDELQKESGTGAAMKLAILDIFGKKVNELIFPTGMVNQRVYRGNLPEGIYFFELSDEKGIAGRGKMAVE